MNYPACLLALALTACVASPLRADDDDQAASVDADAPAAGSVAPSASGQSHSYRADDAGGVSNAGAARVTESGSGPATVSAPASGGGGAGLNRSTFGSTPFRSIADGGSGGGAGGASGDGSGAASSHDRLTVTIDANHSFTIPSTAKMRLAKAASLEDMPEHLPSAPWIGVIRLNSDDDVYAVGFMTRGMGSSAGNGFCNLQGQEMAALGANEGCQFNGWVSQSPGGAPVSGLASIGLELLSVPFAVGAGGLRPQTVYWCNFSSQGAPKRKGACNGAVLSPMGQQPGQGCIPASARGNAVMLHQLGVGRSQGGAATAPPDSDYCR